MEYQSIIELTEKNNFKDKVSKISLVVVVSCLSFIYWFPSWMLENPAMVTIINKHNSLFSVLWIVLMIVLGAYVVLSIIAETYSRNQILNFELESKQENIFANFLNIEVARFNDEFLGSVFSTQDLARFILETEYTKTNRFLMIIRNTFLNIGVVNELVATSLSEIITKKAVNRKLIRKTDDFPTISESYEILIKYIT
jgi:hypothetical protein